MDKKQEITELKDEKKITPKGVLIECMFPHCAFHIKVQFHKKTKKPTKTQKQVEDEMRDHIERKHYQEYWKMGTEQLIAENMCAEMNQREIQQQCQDALSACPNASLPRTADSTLQPVLTVE